jgi:2-oxoglutarate ferredoxin oxidoreductase subunit alpha
MSDRPSAPAGTIRKGPRRFMAGNEACAEAALAAGCDFFAGYPITPSSEIAEHMAKELPKRGGTFIQMEDEIASIGAAVGASIAGARALTATSGPGFSLKQEILGYACMNEVPVVVVDVMRGGPSTGMPTSSSQGDVMQARWGTHGDHAVIVLIPSTVEETYDETVRAFDLTEHFRIPVVLLLDEIVGHTEESLVIPERVEVRSRPKPVADPAHYRPFEPVESDIPPMAGYGEGYRFHVSGLTHDPTGFPTGKPAEVTASLERMQRKLVRYEDEIVKVKEYLLDDAEYMIFAFGSIARSARAAVRMGREQGLRVGLLQPLTLWPFPDRAIERHLGHLHGIVVPEMNQGMIVREVRRVAGRDLPIRHKGRVDGEPITPQEILLTVQNLESDPGNGKNGR